tara:strand:+ start:4181 stop:4834 length:654 start_codon:yes stop_codon:yes gene_type:complete
MELNLFVYVLLIFCIPFLLYTNFRIQPRKGFSILFISIISTTVILKFSILSLLGIIPLIATLLINKTTFVKYLYLTSFLILNYQIFVESNLTLFDLILTNLFPISLISGVFSSMMIGHWFLVDPTISKQGMKRIALFCTLQSLSIIPLVSFEFIGEDINNLFKNVILFLYLSTSILSFASFKSLGEKSYTGVMASTGLSYLSLIVSLGASGGLLLLA